MLQGPGICLNPRVMLKPSKAVTEAVRHTTQGMDIRRRRLGRTGLLVSELGFGAAHVGTADEGEEALFRAFSLGVNFVETGRAYGESEYLIGRALRRLGEGAPPLAIT